MKPVYKATLIALVIVISVLIISISFLLPSVKPVTTGITEFSADRVIKHQYHKTATIKQRGDTINNYERTWKYEYTSN